MASITKADLINETSKKSEGLYKSDCQVLINTFFDCLASNIANQKTIELRGFASFVPKSRKARMGRNPKKPFSEYLIPDRIIPIANFSDTIKKKLNSNKPQIILA